MIEFFYKIEKNVRMYFLFSILDFFVGVVGMCVYGAYTNVYGPIWVRNQYIGLWLLTLVVIMAILSFFVEVKPIGSNRKKVRFFADLTYFILVCLLSLLMTIFFGIAVKIDAIIWSIYIFAVSLTNVYILFIRTNKESKENYNSNPNETSSLDAKELNLLNSNGINDNANRYKYKCLINAIEILLKLIFLIILIFILAGSIVIGAGKAKYPARGSFINVKLNDSGDREIKVHYLCDGPKNSSYPVFMFEGDASHGMADYLSLQILLKKENKRSCIWDKPGLGYSDYLYKGTKNYTSFYHNFIKSLNENPPYIFVGWGGGGEIIYEYASQHPDMVYSLTFLDVYPNGIEFQTPYILKNWTQSQLEKYKYEEFTRRSGLLNLINSIGVPWGLMGIFFPESKVYFSELKNEVTWYFLTEKTWTTQAYFLPIVIFEESNIFQQLKINSNISLNLIMSYKSDQQVINQTCLPNNYKPDSTECKYEIDSNRFGISQRENLRNLSTTGEIIRCQMDECDLGYFVGIGAKYTVDNLLNLYKNISNFIK